MERSALPLDPPGWETYREVGCFKWLPTDDFGDGSNAEAEVEVEEAEHSPTSCASLCSLESQGGGVGVFGLTADSR